MRKLIGHRFVVLALLGLALYYYAIGPQDAGTGALFIATILWLLGGRQRLVRWRRHTKAEGLKTASITVRPPLGRRESNLDGCYNRLDPAWRAWLFSAPPEEAPGTVDER